MALIVRRPGDAPIPRTPGVGNTPHPAPTVLFPGVASKAAIHRAEKEAQFPGSTQPGGLYGPVDTLAKYGVKAQVQAIKSGNYTPFNNANRMSSLNTATYRIGPVVSNTSKRYFI